MNLPGAPACLAITLGLAVVAVAAPETKPAASPAKTTAPNLLLKALPKDFDGMTPANRKLALKSAQDLMKGFRLMSSSGLGDRATLEDFLKELDADIAPLKSGNEADRAAHAGAQTVFNALRYAGDGIRTGKWNNAAMNTLLRLPANHRYLDDPSVLSDGVGLLLIDYFRLVMGGAYKEADLTLKRPAAETAPAPVRADRP